MPILAIDVGGTHVKVLAEGHKNPIKIDSGPSMTPQIMTGEVLKAASDWKYDRISIGYPGPVENHKPAKDPHNLGPGWVEFPYETAFGKPIRMINDAAMQALGSYHGGRMLFLGLGTGLGSALVIQDSTGGRDSGIVQPMELAHLPYRKGRTYEDYVGLRGLERLGKKRWRRHALEVIDLLCSALRTDSVVLGGGNAKLLKDLPNHIQLGANDNAFKGGFKLWQKHQS
jgi:polyphosphate glucokinase